MLWPNNDTGRPSSVATTDSTTYAAISRRSVRHGSLCRSWRPGYCTTLTSAAPVAAIAPEKGK